VAFLRALSVVLLLAMPAFAGPRIMLDPGHGGAQEGAHGADGAFEKKLCLALAQKLAQELTRELGAQVQLTRDSDEALALPERVLKANAFHPDLFISIHANSMPTRKLRQSTEGIETYFLSNSASDEQALTTADRENGDPALPSTGAEGGALGFILADLERTLAHADSSALAYAVHRALVGRTHAVDQGVRQAPFFVLTGVQAPAILVEVGYISHPQEGHRLGEAAYQETLARGLTQGVAEYLKAREARDGHLTVADTHASATALP
jgi:N-acetylmuramoyl-L-alanine amidase